MPRNRAARTTSSRSADNPTRKLLLFSASLLASIVLGAVLWAFTGGRDVIRQALQDTDLAQPARFVGSDACAGCHRPESVAWRGSHHARAMQHATPSAVLGDFNEAVFEHFGVRSRMFRREDRFFIETDGPDGKIDVFQVKYTFGVDPLQQYLVEFADGRVQALPIAWDSRPSENGGQRWFHLYPEEAISFQDELHWTKSRQNWNFMCAECHSTGVRKNYDSAKNSFRTEFAEISVGCEACHGQGSRHVAWAKSRAGWRAFTLDPDPTFGLLVRYAERLSVTWPIDPRTGSGKPSARPLAHRTEVETCAFCHARRGPLAENWIPGRSLSGTHSVSLLSRGLYDPEGQMEDEVFNHGSFLQSKMYAEGVTCSNCHEPHSGKLRIPGDGVCLQCHATEKFSSADHHRHQSASTPPTCANCHMPVRTYMTIDNRHDHSFRIPRPDRSAQYGVRNACNDCHTDKSAEWAASAVDRWHGPDRKGFQTYGPAFAAARAGAGDAARLLAAVVGDPATPAIARATALSELAAYPSASSIAAARKGLSSADPFVRIAALDAIEPLPLPQKWPLAAPLLEDKVLGVRIRAASLLASPPLASRNIREQRAFDRAAAEFIAAQELNADRPEARAALAVFQQRRGQIVDAEAQFRGAISLDGPFAPAYIGLAEIFRQTKRNGDAVALLREAAGKISDNAALQHALGLALVRNKAAAEDALQALARAAELAPGNRRYGYTHAIALHSYGNRNEALRVLRSLAERYPEDIAILGALAGYEEEAGNFAAALEYTERLVRMRPGDTMLQERRDKLRRMTPPR